MTEVAKAGKAQVVGVLLIIVLTGLFGVKFCITLFSTETNIAKIFRTNYDLAATKSQNNLSVKQSKELSDNQYQLTITDKIGMIVKTDPDAKHITSLMLIGHGDGSPESGQNIADSLYAALTALGGTEIYAQSILHNLGVPNVSMGATKKYTDSTYDYSLSLDENTGTTFTADLK